MHAKFTWYFMNNKVFTMSYYTVYTHLLTFKISEPTEDSNSAPVAP